MREFSGAWMRHSEDFWGGLAAMLVALPAAVAFGVTVYTAIDPQFATFGALAGVLGAAALGLFASIFGGTDRLISAPCAPAAVVLSAFAVKLTADGMEPFAIVLMVTVLGVLSGLLQIMLGMASIGGLIRYTPYPVVSGFMGGVGLVTIGGQLPTFFGLHSGTSWLDCLMSAPLWDWRGVLIGGVTILTLLIAPRLTKKIPGTIIGILAGCFTYALLALFDPSMRQIEGNTLVIGSLNASGEGYIALMADRWRQIGELKLSQVASLIGSAVTLAALLSIDTLKTCVVIDRVTRSQHDPNRELTAQGLANIVAASIGGMPGAGMMGASYVNLSSGAKTRISGILEGVMVLAAALLFGNFVNWIPVAALAGILIVVGLRMIDTDSLRFLESRSTVLDFCVVFVVVIVSLAVDLIAAAAVGVVLSVVLFLREQVGGNVIRRQSFIAERSTAWVRSETEMRILNQKKESAVIYELQGSLFFGTAHRFYVTLKPELERTDCMILDLSRVQSLDVTAVHTLIQVSDMLAERSAPLVLSGLHVTSTRNFKEFLELSGMIQKNGNVIVMPTLDTAIEWAEKRLVGDAMPTDEERAPLELSEIELFKNSQPDTLADLEAEMEKRTYGAGEFIYAMGSNDANLYFVRKGRVNLMGYIGGDPHPYHITTYPPGGFFGGQSFLDHRPRDNEAVALIQTECYVLHPEKLLRLAREHPRVAFGLVSSLSISLATRLRHATARLKIMEEN